MPRTNGLVAEAVATFGAPVVGNFEINQFCPEASAILALVVGTALEQPRLRRVPLPGTCMVAEGENCLELCCHSKLQINAAETFCRREIVIVAILSVIASCGAAIRKYLLED